jgi:predicted metalloprotease
MRWIGRQGSGNVEDRRGMGGRLAIGGGVGGLVILIISLLLGGNPFEGGSTDEYGSAYQDQPSAVTTPEDDQEVQFVDVVLNDTQTVWDELFLQQGSRYIDPRLVVFTDSYQSGCGFASAATGPFYCPADSKVYIDLSFFKELDTRFEASGDFAKAYVIAHEVGHHVQHLMGTTDKVDQARGRLSEKEVNALSVKLELQADFYAGVWAHYEKQMGFLDPGDIEEALQAANAIGDDRLQKQSQGYVVPDSFTHGTSKQRMYWFKKGYETGDLSQGDTFTEVQ